MKRHKKNPPAYNIEMLRQEERKFYKVQQGETIEGIAVRFGVSAYRIATENGLQAPLHVGQVLSLPKPTGMYTVQANDTRALICGSDEAYLRKNGTDVFYLGMRVQL